MHRIELSSVLVALAVFLPATWAQADTGKTICDHLAQNASDYDAEDASACETEIVSFLADLDAEKQEKLRSCVVSHKPITKEQFGECLMGIMGDEASVEPVVEQADIQKLCAHLEANAEEFSKEDFAECDEGMATLSSIVGAEAYQGFSACVMTTPRPNKATVESCMEKAMGVAEPVIEPDMGETKAVEKKAE